METLTILAVTSVPLLNLLIWVLVGGLIFWLLWWLIDYIALPQPFNKVVKVLIAIAAVIFLINIILSVMGKPF